MVEEIKDIAGAQKPSYNYTIDAIKFLSVIAVVLIHVTVFLPHRDLATVSNYYIYRHALDIAVPFFFAVSGFFIAGKENVGYIGVYAKKIFTMYVVFSILYIFIRFLFILSDRLILNKSFWSSTENLVNSLSITNVLNGTIGSYHLWFLAALFISSLLLFTTLHFKLKPKTIFLISLIFYLMNTVDLFGLSAIVKYEGFPQGFFYLAMGYYLGSKRPVMNHPLLWFILSVILYTSFRLIFLGGISVLFLAVAVYSLVVFCICYPGRDNLFSRLGGYALGIYILHVMVLKIVIKIYIYSGIEDYYNQEYYIGIATFFSVSMPILLYKPINNIFVKPLSKIIGIFIK
jgi:peptidoglycan/LPS O-acetylase OafA/YrhL